MRIVIKIEPEFSLSILEGLRNIGIDICPQQKSPNFILGEITKHTPLQKIRELPGVKYVETCLYESEY